MISTEDSISQILHETIVSSPKSDGSSSLDEIVNNRKSMRSSFENFVDSRLSDILEFEEETIRQTLIHDQNENCSSGMDSMNSDFVTKLLASSLGPADRLSNGCADIEKYSLKIPVQGGNLHCTISSSLVSAMVIFIFYC